MTDTTYRDARGRIHRPEPGAGAPKFAEPPAQGEVSCRKWTSNPRGSDSASATGRPEPRWLTSPAMAKAVKQYDALDHAEQAAGKKVRELAAPALDHAASEEAVDLAARAAAGEDVADRDPRKELVAARAAARDRAGVTEAKRRAKQDVCNAAAPELPHLAAELEEARAELARLAELYRDAAQHVLDVETVVLWHAAPGIALRKRDGLAVGVIATGIENRGVTVDQAGRVNVIDAINRLTAALLADLLPVQTP